MMPLAASRGAGTTAVPALHHKATGTAVSPGTSRAKTHMDPQTWPGSGEERLTRPAAPQETICSPCPHSTNCRAGGTGWSPGGSPGTGRSTWGGRGQG
jgi:hypothetical protein